MNVSPVSFREAHQRPVGPVCDPSFRDEIQNDSGDGHHQESGKRKQGSETAPMPALERGGHVLSEARRTKSVQAPGHSAVTALSDR